jgi:hypothetical protein
LLQWLLLPLLIVVGSCWRTNSRPAKQTPSHLGSWW